MNLAPKVFSLLERGINRVILVPKSPILIRTEEKEVIPAHPETVTSPQDVRDTLGGLATLANYQLVMGATRASEGTFSFSTSELGRLRVNFIIQRGTPVVCVERLPLEIPDINSLFEDSENLKQLLGLLELDTGILLFTDIDEEFISMVILSLLKYINNNKSKIIYTVEKPIRYLLNNNRSVVIQREVEVDVENFPNGIYQALHLNADILYTSDIPNTSTLSSLITLANKGTLCLVQYPSLSPALAVNTLARIYGDPVGFKQIVKDLFQAIVSLSAGKLSLVVRKEDKESLLYGT